MRNLVVCCDGTWNTADQREDGAPVPTNVVRLYNSLAGEHDGKAQIKYYHPGVGTDPGWLEHVEGGLTGEGLNRNIMSAYQWLCRTYEDQDRIFLFGFSRGAYTVRSLAGLVAHCGLLSFDDVTPEDVWPRVGRVFQKGYRDHLETRKDWQASGWKFHTAGGKEDIPIYLVGVWDTVGALGIPKDLGVLNLLDASDEHAFHDTNLSTLIQHARHAVALDEMRASFQPTLWIDNGQSDLKQVWFPGVHCDVGGGYRDCGLADGALKWMMDEAEALGLGFDPDLRAQVRPLARGILHDSCTSVFKLLPTQPRSAPRVEAVAEDGRSGPHASLVERRRCPPITDAPYRATVPILAAEADVRRFDVYAVNPWNATGLYLEAGVKYRFTAAGQWLDRSIACGPAGTNDGHFQPGEALQAIGTALGELENVFKKLTNNARADFRLTKRHERLQNARVPWFCLVGAVANGGRADANGDPEEHEAFAIGAGCEYVPRASGYLYAYANDAWNFYSNNRGSLSLEVTRLR